MSITHLSCVRGISLWWISLRVLRLEDGLLHPLCWDIGISLDLKDSYGCLDRMLRCISCDLGWSTPSLVQHSLIRSVCYKRLNEPCYNAGHQLLDELDEYNRLVIELLIVIINRTSYRGRLLREEARPFVFNMSYCRIAWVCFSRRELYIGIDSGS